MYFSKFDIETNKSQIENLKILEQIICTDKLPWFSFNFDYKNKPFYGTLTKGKFDIIPVVDGRNSFVPVISGVISNGNRSIVTIKMRMHYAIILILIFMFSFLSVILYTEPISITNLFLIIFVIYIIYEYKTQCKKSKLELMQKLK